MTEEKTDRKLKSQNYFEIHFYKLFDVNNFLKNVNDQIDYLRYRTPI